MIILHTKIGGVLHLYEDCIESFNDNREVLDKPRWKGDTELVTKSGQKYLIKETADEIEQMISKEHPTNAPIQGWATDGKESKFSYSTHLAEGYPTTLITIPQGTVRVVEAKGYGRIYGLHVANKFGEEEYAAQLMSEAERVLKCQGAKKIFIDWSENIVHIYMKKYAQMHGYKEIKNISTRTSKLFEKDII